MNVNSKRILISLLTVGLLGYLLGWSSLFEVREIRVTGIEGSKTLSDKKVIKDSGVQLGDKLARINSGDVARSLRKYPEIARVEVNRKPLHAIEISVTLRSIDLAITTNTGKFLLGDASGVTFVEVSKAPRGIPIITGDRRYLEEGMSIYYSLPKKIRARVDTISLPSRASIAFSLRGGLTILWGSATELEAKLTVLDALLQAPENKKARFIDIATPLTPTVR